MPSTPNGMMRRSNTGSKSLRKAALPSTSITSSSGIKIAAASATVTDKAIIGTAKDPKPEPKPLLLTPNSSTAGMATA